MYEEQVKANIHKIVDRKNLALTALCKYYAELVIQDFKSSQNSQKYWMNQSNFAKDLMFAKNFFDPSDNSVGFFMSHGVKYGVYLELANDEKHAAIRPTIMKFLPQFKEEVKKLYAD